MRAQTFESKGILAARAAIALALAGGNREQAAAFAKAQGWRQKAAVPGMETDDLTAGGLAARELFELIAEVAPPANLPGARELDFGARILTVDDADPAAGWSGGGRALPVVKATLTADVMTAHRAGAITVITREAAQAGKPSTVKAVRDALVRNVAATVARAFLDVANAGGSGVPKSITHDLTPIPSSDHPAEDLRAAAASMGNVDPANLVLISDGQTLLQMGLFNADQTILFPELGINGGMAGGIPAFATRGSPRSGTGQIVLLDASAIAYAFGELEIMEATAAMVELSSVPNAEAGAIVSLFQSDLIGIRASLPVDWRLTRAGTAAVITGANYLST